MVAVDGSCSQWCKVFVTDSWWEVLVIKDSGRRWTALVNGTLCLWLVLVNGDLMVAVVGGFYDDDDGWWRMGGGDW